MRIDHFSLSLYVSVAGTAFEPLADEYAVNVLASWPADAPQRAALEGGNVVESPVCPMFRYKCDKAVQRSLL